MSLNAEFVTDFKAAKKYFFLKCTKKIYKQTTFD